MENSNKKSSGKKDKYSVIKLLKEVKVPIKNTQLF
jgi:hypothetical protein